MTYRFVWRLISAIRSIAVFVERDNSLWQALESIVVDEGLQLYDLEKLGNGGLRVTIDSTGGVTSGQCSKVCKRLMAFFLVEGASFSLPSEPQIEVSSPGINRALRLSEHFSGAIGERIKVIPTELESNNKKSKKSFIGNLDSFENDTLTVTDEQTNEAVLMSLASVKKARVEFKF